MCGCIPVTPALSRQRQKIRSSRLSLNSTRSSRPAWVTGNLRSALVPPSYHLSPPPSALLLPPRRPGQPSQAATTTGLSLRFCLFWMLAINGIEKYTAALCHRFSHVGTKIPQRNEDNLKGVCVSHSGYLKQSSLGRRDFPSGFTNWEKEKAEACWQSNRKYGSTKREVISSGVKTDQ